jgi:hypothetical protein
MASGPTLAACLTLAAQTVTPRFLGLPVKHSCRKSGIGSQGVAEPQARDQVAKPDCLS